MKKTVERIERFTGEYAFLSNFWPAVVAIGGYRYPSAEHAYQAQKCMRASEKLYIAMLVSPKEAKKFGRKVKPRKDWPQVKLLAMRRVVEAKFLQEEELAELLLATGDSELVEGNDWGDTFWGVCEGAGENNLGKILMEVRDQLRRREV